MKPGDGTTVIGRPATLRGDLSSTDDLQIEGEVEGTIRLSGGRLTVGPEARVRADVYAPEVVVFGMIEGDIWAAGRVDLRSTAVVLGDVFAGRLCIEENATLRGQVDPSRANETARPMPVAASAPSSASRPAQTTASGPRTSDLFNMQTGSALHQSRQMPSALAAIAAASRQEAGTDAGTPNVDGEEGDDVAGTVA